MANPRRSAPLVSVVIPVFNQWDLTAKCLEALPAATASVPHEVIVVDNASTDATGQQLARWKTPIRVLRNEVNLGFAGACNQGADAASAPNVVFLNNDTVPIEGWLDALVDEVRRHDDVWAVGSRLLYGDGSIQHAGVAFTRETRSPYHPYRSLRADDPRVSARREVQAVTAACVLVRADRFAQCGRFHEGYRNGYEDLDLCLSIRNRHAKIVYQPRSVVVHLESRTPGRMRRDAENRELFFGRWFDSLLSDEDHFYFQDGLHVVRTRDEPDRVRLVRFESEDERVRWGVVARLEQDAAEGRRREVLEAFERVEAWPDDAGVRAWAAALCLRFGRPGPARRHLDAALAHGADAGVRAQAALTGDGAALPATTHPWEVPLHTGLRELRASRWAPARRALELALGEGAPPALVLPGLWEAAWQLADTTDAESLRGALRALPRVDPATDRRLRERSRALPDPDRGSPATAAPGPAAAARPSAKTT